MSAYLSSIFGSFTGWAGPFQGLLLLLSYLMTFISRRLAGSWVHPSPAVAVAWLVYLTIATVAGFNRAPLVALLITGIIAASMLSSVIRISANEVHSWMVTGHSVGIWVAVSGLPFGFFAGLLTLRANGIAPSLSFTGLGDAARSATIMRYEGDLHIPILANLLLAFMYGAALASPYMANRLTGWKRVAVVLSPAVGGAAFAMATTARAAFLIATLTTFASWLSVRGVEGGGRVVFSMKSGLALVATGCGIIGVFMVAALIRLGGWSGESMQRLHGAALVYSGGGVPAFESKLRSGVHDGSRLRFGAESFAGISKLLGFDPASKAAYKDRAPIGEGLSTNVYTVLRPISEDFGLGGAVFFWVVGSLMAAACYRRAIRAASVASSVCVSLWMAFCFFAGTTSMYTFSNVSLGLLLGSMLVIRCASFRPTIPPPRSSHDAFTEGAQACPSFVGAGVH